MKKGEIVVLIITIFLLLIAILSSTSPFGAFAVLIGIILLLPTKKITKGKFKTKHKVILLIIMLVLILLAFAELSSRNYAIVRWQFPYEEGQSPLERFNNERERMYNEPLNEGQDNYSPESDTLEEEE
jgi:O-antigen ligase